MTTKRSACPYRPALPAAIRLFLVLPWTCLAFAQEVDTSPAEKARGYTYLNELRGRADMLPFASNAELEAAAQNHSDYLALPRAHRVSTPTTAAIPVSMPCAAPSRARVRASFRCAPRSRTS